MPYKFDTVSKKEESVNSFASAGGKNPSIGKTFLPKAAGVKKTKELLNLLAKTFTSLRIYPPENPTVETLTQSLIEKMQEFLIEHQELILTIHEFSFSFKQETVFTDEQKKASLPFLFFKDGMRELVFYKGLDRQELQAFLKVLKVHADLPPEDSDIVNSLWTKDFPHIRHFAVDEFLDSEIAEEIPFNIIDKEEISKGTIELCSSDLQEIDKRNAASNSDSTDILQEKEQDISLGDIPLPFQTSSVSKEESPEIESLLEEHRSTPPLTEMINLLFEILYLEDRRDDFSSILNVLNQFYKEVVYTSLFALASLILHRLQELSELFSGRHEEKKEMLEKTLQHIKSESSLAFLKKLFMNNQIDDFDSFFGYLKHLGPNTIPLIADIWEEAKTQKIRRTASDLLYEIGKKDVPSLFAVAKDHRINLIKEIIPILGKIGNSQALPFLEKFIDNKDKEIRFSVILALGKLNDERAKTLLLEFLSDQNGEIRIQAARALKHCEDQTVISHVIRIAEKKDFRYRLKQEKKILLDYLAETRSQEVSALLRSILKKRSILYKGKQNETRLCAVPALEKMANPEAQKILKEGARFRNKTIRRACQIALRKIKQNFESKTILAGEHSA